MERCIELLWCQKLLLLVMALNLCAIQPRLYVIEYDLLLWTVAKKRRKLLMCSVSLSIHGIKVCQGIFLVLNEDAMPWRQCFFETVRELQSKHSSKDFYGQLRGQCNYLLRSFWTSQSWHLKDARVTCNLPKDSCTWPGVAGEKHVNVTINEL